MEDPIAIDLRIYLGIMQGKFVSRFKIKRCDLRNHFPLDQVIS
jgi:hypothetical protein